MDQVFFYHHRIGRAAITFAISIGPKKESDEENERWVQYSYAICSPKDQFSRAKGRTIAEGRLRHIKHRHVSGFSIKESDEKMAYKMVWSDFFASVTKRADWVHRVGWLQKLAKLLLRADNISKGVVIRNDHGIPIPNYGIEDVYSSIRKLTRGGGNGCCGHHPRNPSGQEDSPLRHSASDMLNYICSQ